MSVYSKSEFKWSDHYNWHLVTTRKGIKWPELNRWVIYNIVGNYVWEPSGLRMELKSDAVLFTLTWR